MISDPIAALLEVVRVLEDLGLDYAIGGSVASSVFGEPRASADADLLVELAERDVPGLLEKLAEAFYVSDDAAREAVRRRSAFNVIHLRSMYKIDLFVAGSGPLDREQLRRREEIVIAREPESRAYVTAPENIVLRKLDWYRTGGEISDQQWRDVQGVLKVQAETIDLAYLQALADRVGLSVLLGRALRDAGLTQD
jgi:hypothetical protein